MNLRHQKYKYEIIVTFLYSDSFNVIYIQKIIKKYLVSFYMLYIKTKIYMSLKIFLIYFEKIK